MIQPILLEKLENLPEALQFKVIQYVDSLMKEKNEELKHEDTPKKYRRAGTMKGLIIMADDFDEPLDDFKEYMSSQNFIVDVDES